MADPTFTMFEGDSKTINCQVLDADNNAVDITGASIRWWLAKKANKTGADVLIKKSTGAGNITITNAAEGRYAVSLLPTDTIDLKGDYYYEAEVDDNGIISTVLTGTVRITEALIPPE